MGKKVKLFIGSSTEGIDVARAVQSGLRDIAEATIWDQGVFSLSKNYLFELLRSLNSFEFAILIFTPDDQAKIREKKVLIPRDNVIFETGLFMGKLGSNRVFVLRPEKVEDFHILSDFLGIKTGKYDSGKRNIKALRQAVGHFCNEVREKIQEIQEKSENKLLNEIIKHKLEVVSRAISSPELPEFPNIRLFVFKKNDNYLVCQNFWAIHPVSKPEGKVSFELTKEWGKKVIVVRSVLEDDIIGEEVGASEQEKLNSIQPVSKKITFVLSSSISNQDGTVWGAVAADTLSHEGKKLLNNKASRVAITQLSKSLELLISFDHNSFK